MDGSFVVTKHHLVAEPWSLLIYRVSDRQSQHQILQILDSNDAPRVLAVGAEADPGLGPHVIVESSTIEGEAYSRAIILSADPRAEYVHGTRSLSLRQQLTLSHD